MKHSPAKQIVTRTRFRRSKNRLPANGDAVPDAVEIVKGKMRPPYRAEDQAGRQAMRDSLMRTRALGTGPAIRPSQLAALVVQKLGNSKCKAKESAAEVWAEIESTLDLVEMCQWALHLRQNSWRQRVGVICGVEELEKRRDCPGKAAEPNGALGQLWKNVKNRKYPLSFSEGLQAMGNRSYPVERRMTRFSSFFLAGVKKWNWDEVPDKFRTLFFGMPNVPAPRALHSARSKQPASAWDEIDRLWEINPDYQLTESDIRKWIEKKGLRWPDEETLWWVTQKWFEWAHAEEEKANRSKAGVASGEARRKNKR